MISYSAESVRNSPSFDPVSVAERLSDARRGYTDAGSVQAREPTDKETVAHISRRCIDGRHVSQ